MPVTGVNAVFSFHTNISDNVFDFRFLDMRSLKKDVKQPAMGNSD